MLKRCMNLLQILGIKLEKDWVSKVFHLKLGLASLGLNPFTHDAIGSAGVTVRLEDELKARSAELHAVEEPKRKLTSEKASLQERITRLERKNADEIAVIEGSFEKERKALKLRILELEMKLEEVTKDLAVVQSALGAKDTELSPLQNNLRELEDLRETKEDIDRKNEQTAAILELKTLRCKLSFVDLAGSERVKKSGSSGGQLKEAQSINKSLSALRDVIGALSSSNQHIPYRNHKLTMLMSDSLGGNAKTLMFVNISQAESNLDETYNSLMYASRVRSIVNDLNKNVSSKEVACLKRLVAYWKEQAGQRGDD
ncbi:Kinesin-like calmodulin-binding protein [Abeliophyllum distichum]|uniref:Kinesin-like calmodulin-binding protein n=1 Tax=Abeliophyllum distichum TaxID=126358 RepID=A0ABD1V1L1_9LAMI